MLGRSNHDGALEPADTKTAHIFGLKTQGIFFAIGCQQRAADHTRKYLLAVGITQIQCDAKLAAPDFTHLHIPYLDVIKVNGGKVLMPRPFGGAGRVAGPGLRLVCRRWPACNCGAFTRRFRSGAASAEPAQHKLPTWYIFFTQQFFKVLQPFRIGLCRLRIAFKAQHIVPQLHVLLPQSPAQPSQNSAGHGQAGHHPKGRHKPPPAHSIAAPGAVIPHQDYAEIFAVLQTVLTNFAFEISGWPHTTPCYDTSP